MRRPTGATFLVHNVARKISLKIIYRIQKLVKDYLPPGGEDKREIPPECRCISAQTTGYPCIHIIKDHWEAKRSLTLAHFHHHWHLFTAEAPPIDARLLAREPRTLPRSRGRPAGSISSTRANARQDSSIHRDALSCEITLSQERAQARRIQREARAQAAQNRAEDRRRQRDAREREAQTASEQTQASSEGIQGRPEAVQRVDDAQGCYRGQQSAGRRKRRRPGQYPSVPGGLTGVLRF